MMVVADSHILLFCVSTTGRLSDAALAVLGEAEDDARIAGVGVVAAGRTEVRSRARAPSTRTYRSSFPASVAGEVGARGRG